ALSFRSVLRERVMFSQCFAPASSSGLKEDGFLGAKLQRSCFNVVALRLCLRLRAGSEKWGSSAQRRKEA
ncbi:hypothetical protein, partial [Geobacillus jurassicus]